MNNIYLLYGLDKSLIDKEVKKIKKGLNIEEINIIKYDLNNDSLDLVMEEIMTPSMFSSSKLIIIDNSNIFTSSKDSNIVLLEKYLDNYDKNVYIVFICNVDKLDNRKKITKLVDKNGKIIELKKGDQTYVIDYVKNYLQENGYQINSFDLNNLLLKTGNDLNIITNELNKLFMYKMNDKIITSSDVDKLVIKNIDDDIFKLTDAILNKDKQKIIELYNNFKNNNYEITYLVGLLASQFRFLYQVKRLSNLGKTKDEITSILQVHPYRVKLAISNNYQYTENNLLCSIDKLFNVDRNIKLGLMDKNISIELFLLQI